MMSTSTTYTRAENHGFVNILDTGVETASMLEPLEYLVYLWRISLDGSIIVRPLNKENIHCWSHDSPVTTFHNTLIATIKIIWGKIILGVNHDLYAKIFSVGTKLILDANEKQYEMGAISEVYRHAITSDPSIQPTSPYIAVVEKFVIQSKIDFAKQRILTPILYAQRLQERGFRNERGGVLRERQRHENAQGDRLVGTFEEGFLLQGNIILSDGTTLTGSFNKQGLLESGAIIHRNGDFWSVGNLTELENLTGCGKLTLPTGDTYQGFFNEGRLFSGKKTALNGDFLLGEFATEGFSGNGKVTYCPGLASLTKVNFKVVKMALKKLVDQFGIVNAKTTWKQVEKELLPKLLVEASNQVQIEGIFQKSQLIHGKITDASLYREGDFQSGLLARGKIVYPGGYWQEGTFMGMGEQKNSDGISYKGTFEHGILIEGKEKHPDGRWIKGIFVGMGKQENSNGVHSEGVFENGRLVQGEKKYPNGDWLKGSLDRRGKLHDGLGRRTSRRKIKEGIFKDGHLINGKKVCISSGIIYEGLFKDGRLIQGKEVHPDGFWAEGTFAGWGKVTRSDGSWREGLLKDGCFIQGKWFDSSKETIYEGVYNGHGKQIDQEGVVCEGFFRCGELTDGRANWPDGVILVKDRKTYDVYIPGRRIPKREGVHSGEYSQIPSRTGPERGGYEIFSCNAGIDDDKGDDKALEAWFVLKSHRPFLLLVEFEPKNKMSKDQRALDSVLTVVRWWLDGSKLSPKAESFLSCHVLKVLKVVKMIDILSKKEPNLKFSSLRSPYKNRSTYQLRQWALRNAPMRLNTAEAYTLSLNPEDYHNVDYLTNPSSWVNERLGKQAKLIIDYKILSESLSHRIRRVVATRGNTGAGKSFFINRYLDEQDHLIHGILNPDYIKAILKKLDGHLLLNGQVYLEGRIVFERLIEELIQNTSGLTGAVIDTRLLEKEDFKKVFAFAQSREAQLEVIDVDASIWCSILSVLNRDPSGGDPCVPFEVIKDGFLKARANRAEFISMATTSEQVNYSLYRLGKDGQYIRVVRKEEGDHLPLITVSLEEFEECLQVPKEEEMEEIANTIISEELIQSLDVPRNKQVLMGWLGFTVKEALEIHSKLVASV